MQRPALLSLAALALFGCGSAENTPAAVQFQGPLTVRHKSPMDTERGGSVTYGIVNKDVPTVIRQAETGYVFEPPGACDGLAFVKVGEEGSATVDPRAECANAPSFTPTEGSIAVDTDGMLTVDAKFSDYRTPESTLHIFGKVPRSSP